MNTRLRQLLAVLCSAFASAVPVQAGEQPVLEIYSTTPTVRLEPRQTGRFVRLPTIEFEFRLKTDCPEALGLASVTVSVADTRNSFSGSGLAGDEAAPISLLVPASQLAPVAAEEFCRADEGEAPQNLLQTEEIFTQILTAQASLRCTGDNDEAIAYVSHALDVRLQCEHRQADDTQAGGDQQPVATPVSY